MNKLTVISENEIYFSFVGIVMYFKEIIRQQGFFKTQLWQMADDLREIKDAITISNLRKENQDDNRQQDTPSVYSSFELPLRNVKDIEETVEQFLKVQNNFERSVRDML